jgi:heme-degrading monooxygenase HmoA
MLARVARYDIDPERCEDAVRAFEEAGQALVDFEGFVRGYLLVDSESGTTMTVTLWSNQATLGASETRASLLRQRAVREVDGAVQSVLTFDITRELGTFEG